MHDISPADHKFFKKRFFLIIVYTCFILCLTFICFNLTTVNLDKSIKVLAEGITSLENGRLFLKLGQVPQESLNLEIEYFAPQTINTPRVFLNNNPLKCYKSLRNGPINDYFKSIREGLTQIDYFNSSEHFIKQDENVLIIKFKEKYPSEISVKLKNFLYKLPSNNLVISFAERKDKFIFFAPLSYILIFVLTLITLGISLLLSKILNTTIKQIFTINRTIVLIFTIVFAIGLIITRLTNFMIKMNYFYFAKLVVFCFYNMTVFSFYGIRKTCRNKKMLLGRTNPFNAYGTFFNRNLFFYFLAVLSITLGLLFIELFIISSRIAVLGDLIIIILFIKLLNHSIRYMKREAVS